MLTRRKFIKSSLLPILYQCIPAFPEANFPGLYSPLPSKELQNKCFGILSNALLKSDADDYCNARLIAALGEIGTPSAIPLLIKELNNPDRESQKEIIAYYLAKLGEQKGIDYLLESVNSRDCIFKRDANNFLCDLYGIAVPIMPEKEETLNPEEIKKEINALKDSDDLVDRGTVVRLMGKSGDQSYMPYLQSLLWDCLVRGPASVGLYHLDDPTIVPFLIKSLNGENDYNPGTAFSSLCEIGDQGFIPALKKALKVHEEDRSENIISLYKSDYPIQTIRCLLREFLYDRDPDVQLQAAIGYYYKEKPAFYDSYDYSRREMFICAKLLPCDLYGNGCDIKNCSLFKNRPEIHVEKLLGKV